MVIRPKRQSMATDVRNLKGSLVAIVTPMKDECEKPVDFEALKTLVEFVISKGAQGVVVTGTTGEGPCVDEHEWAAVVRCCVEVGKNRVPIITSTGTNCTRGTIEKTKKALAIGSDAVMVVAPYYNKPTQDGLYEHYKAVAQSVPDLPIMIYNVPSRTASDVQPTTVARISKACSNVYAIKEASGGKVERYAQLRKLCGDNFRVYSGEDNEACEAMLGGCDGCVSVAANVVPEEHQLMCAVALKGQAAEARRLDAKLHPLYKALFLETNPIPTKWLLGHMGVIAGGAIRLPLLPLSESHHDAVRAAFAAATV